MTETTAPATRSRLPLAAIVVAAIGSALALVGFYTSIIQALDASGSGPGAYLYLLAGGLALDLVATVLAIVALVRNKGSRLPWIAIAFALVPALVFAWLAISARL